MNKNSEIPSPQPTRTLKQFDVLIGKWDMAGVHPALPATVHGHSSFEWLREGALLAWHSDWDHGQGIPSSFSVIGQDDSVEACSMLYTDERGVTRIYQMTLADGVWKMWRESPGFSQRMSATFSSDGNSIAWSGELSREDATWETDLSVTYTRRE